MKKYLVLISLLLVVFAMFTGCGKDEDAKNTSTSSTTTIPSIPNLDDNFTCEEHVFGEWQEVFAPTCTEDGLQQCVCTVCFQQIVAGIPKKGHVPTTEDGYIKPTCKTEGKTARTVCSTCNKVLEESEIIPKLDHEYDLYGYCINCFEKDPFNDLRIVIFTKPEDSAYSLTAVLDSLGLNYTFSYVMGDVADTLSSYDIYIYNGVCPSALPTDGATWLLNPPSLPNNLSSSFTVFNSSSEGYPISLVTSNPVAEIINKNVNESSGSIRLSASAYRLFTIIEDGLFPIMVNEENPVMFAGSVNNLPVIITAFSFSDSSLPTMVSAFPILINNMARYSFDVVHKIERPSCTHERVNIDAIDPTCVNPGLTKGIKCSKCGKILIPQEVVKPTGKHDLDETGNCKNCDYYEAPLETGNSLSFVLDLSTSMNVALGEKTRIDAMIDSLSALILDQTEGKMLDSSTFINVILFDSDVSVALEFTQLDFDDKRQNIANEIKQKAYHYFYYYYLDSEGNETDVPFLVGDPQTKVVTVEIEGVETEFTLFAPQISSEQSYDSKTLQYIKSHGTNYRFTIQEVAAAISHLKEVAKVPSSTVIFISDGAPNDKGSGYENTVRLMEKRGIVFSTILLGSCDTEAMNELQNLSNLGNGAFMFVETELELSTALKELTSSNN